MKHADNSRYAAIPLPGAKENMLLPIAAQLPGHDDRQQFMAGIDLILAGTKAIR